VRNCTVVGCRNLRVCNVRDALSLDGCAGLWDACGMGVGFRMELLKMGGCLRADDSARDAPGLFLQSVSASTDVRCSGGGEAGQGGVVIDCGARDALMGWRMDGQGETRRLGENETDRGDILRR